jgi:hypothetical protein
MGLFAGLKFARRGNFEFLKRIRFGGIRVETIRTDAAVSVLMSCDVIFLQERQPEDKRLIKFLQRVAREQNMYEDETSVDLTEVGSDHETVTEVGTSAILSRDVVTIAGF